ncbi:short-chain fatty acyl-CoA regulator family protein [Celeribacter sp.]|uniref:short-chain fatty acyl-CoA regulator family protein n=1 Tax=Celeribacter sp. TaxID=1890673 RepID=UPI003A90587C
MPRTSLTGSRIRERRTLKAIKQADLARRVGISPAYLNLIEHNRRRIGGKLLVDLARELETDVLSLTEGAQAPLVEGLRAAAAEAVGVSEAPETDRTEEFAGRFPGWAALLVHQRGRLEALERRVEALSDRLAHDPFLSDALHDLLSTVTAVRSTAGILNTGDDIDPEWRARFHRNLYEDSQRLAEGAQSLVTYLDTIGESEISASTPLDEVEAWLAARGYALEAERAAASKGGTAKGSVTKGSAATGEKGGADAPSLGAASTEKPSPALTTQAARELAALWEERARQDAAALPLPLIEDALGAQGLDPLALARAGDVPLDVAMRRLATLPPDGVRANVGLVQCDGSGMLTFRKPLDGFSLPRFGAACPLWPLYQALLRPMVPLRRVLEVPGQPARRFLTYAICRPREGGGFDAPQIVEATMMFVPIEAVDERERAAAGEAALEVGSTCRVCPRSDCAARREPSMVVGEGPQPVGQGGIEG